MSGALQAASAATTSRIMKRTNRIRAGTGHAVKAGAALALVLAGCGFRPVGTGGAVADAGDDDALDPDGPIAEDGGIDGAPDAGPDAAPPTGFCADDPGNLVLCATFDDQTATNAVSGGAQAATATVTYPAGRVGRSAGFDGTSNVLWWGEDGRFDFTGDFTIEMFVFYSQDPPTTGAAGSRRRGLVDNNSQYSMFLGWHDFGQGDRVAAYCNASGTIWGAPLSRNAWHHVACVRSAGFLAIYTDGVIGQTQSASPPPTNGSDGLTFGQDGDNDPNVINDPLIGAIDEVRIWRTGRRPDQIFSASQR